jgi:phosphoenolpyruvate phosphomutase
MKNNQKKVYVALAVDLIHRGHLNILNIAKKYGKVTVGLLTDRAICSYKKPPILDFKERLNIAKNLKAVDSVMPQESLDYTKNLKLLKPDFVVHGDDWKKGIQKNIRKKVVDTLKIWNGKLIEPKYTEGISSSKINDIIKTLGTTPDIRRKSLKRYLEMRGFVRFLDIHNGLSGLIIENTKVKINGKIEEFDGMWGSSLTNSTAKGKPDIEAVDLTERLQLLNEVLEVTTKPIIYDGDTGGKTEHFVFTVKTLERLGVSAVIIEDKKGLKKNSLFGTEVFQQLDSINSFAKKIKAGKKAKSTNEFMIIARLESLIMNKGIGDAVKRAKAYINAGADGIMIHSKKRDPSEIFEFCKIYNRLKNRKPLVVVPSSYSQVKEKDLIKAGANIIIYANHLMRSVYPNMVKTAKSILKNKRSLEAEKKLLSIKEILELIPGTK